MRKRNWAVFLIITLCWLAAGCSSNPYRHYKDNEMIGFVSSIDQQNQTVIIDISEWSKRNLRGSSIPDYGVQYTAKVLPRTIIQNDAGTKLSLADLKTGQKLQINPPDPKSETPDELLILPMSKDELYRSAGLLSREKGKYHISVIEESDSNPDYSLKAFQAIPGAMAGGISWLTIDPNHVLNLKQEFSLDTLPVILVFDTKKLVLKTQKINDIKEFLEARA
ncbi:hypothetical protein [Paenibacillus spongiae]|uniref:Uncharacterized protein n=1 Tax=Paenibacillus spongiae TaxID=2909671 RepID=A0ABY5SHS8_9BACL|nr:hypothetical protein [Paenibacillus spongiae]UVI33304.1 hypothetical protein L1F29_16300 [Paenibacillus spongiae]